MSLVSFYGFKNKDGPKKVIMMSNDDLPLGKSIKKALILIRSVCVN